MTAQLEHPGIVPIHEAGRRHDGTPYYAMKLVAGSPLNAMIASARTAADRRALLPRLASVADAVAYAHDRGIIHRDLKPSNIVIGEYGETVVIDWGLAKSIQEDEGDRAVATSTDDVDVHHVTREGTVIGTPAYMSPEQAAGASVDERTDVFALGTILREIAAPPLMEGTDPDLEAIIRKATAATVASRYRTAREFATDLHAYAVGRRVSARRYNAIERAAHWIRRHESLAYAFGAAAVLVIVIGVVAVARIISSREAAQESRIDAERALAVAREKQRDAILARADLLAQQDPTAAWQLLHREGLAKALSAGDVQISPGDVAYRELDVGGSTIIVAGLQDAHRALLVAFDGTLQVIDIESGARQVVDRELALPVRFARRREMIAYVVRRGGRFSVVVARFNERPRVVATLDVLPAELRLAERKLFVRDEVGVVSSIDIETGEVTAFDERADSIGPFRGGLLTCSDGILRYDIGPTRKMFSNGRCRGAIGASGDYAIIPLDDHTIEVHANGAVRTVAFDTTVPPPRYDMAESGLVIGVARDGAGLLLLPEATDFERIPFVSGRPTTFAALGTIGAWGFSDGTVVVFDGAEREMWTIKAHGRPVDSIEMAASDRDVRLLVGTARSLRVWELNGPAVLYDDTLPAPASFAASDDHGTVVLDSADGASRLMTPDHEVRVLHHHENQAIGAAWCGSFACTASWDGSIICTEPTAGTRIERRRPVSVKWLEPVTNDCVYGDANGSVGLVLEGTELVTGDFPTIGRVRRDDGALVLATREGTVIVYSLRERGVVERRPNAHASQVTSITSSHGWTATAGKDRCVRFWDTELQNIATVCVDATPLGAAAAGDRLFVATDDGHVYGIDSAGEVVLSLDVHATPLDVVASRDGRIAVVTSRGDVALIQGQTLAVAIYHVGSQPLVLATFVLDRLLVLSQFGDVYFVS